MSADGEQASRNNFYGRSSLSRHPWRWSKLRRLKRTRAAALSSSYVWIPAFVIQLLFFERSIHAPFVLWRWQWRWRWRWRECGGAAVRMAPELREAKIQEYEAFVDKRLKPDLVHAISQRDKVLDQLQMFSDLAKNVKRLEENNLTKIRTMVNLGSEVYCQAEVSETSHMFVDIGLGFHVEFTWSEALQFINVKEKMLKRQVEAHTCQIADIKAQIKLVGEGIRELMNLTREDVE